MESGDSSQSEAYQAVDDTPLAPGAPDSQRAPAAAEDQPRPESVNATVNLARDRTRLVEWFQLGINGLLALIAIGAVCIYGGQLGVMKGQLAEMQIAREPWIGGGQIEFQNTEFLVYPENPPQARTQVDVLVQIPMKNFGVGPAFHVDAEVSGTMTREIPAPQSSDRDMDDACERADRNSQSVGTALFPNEPEDALQMPINMMVPLIRIDEVRRVWIEICIAYSNASSGEHLRHTKIWAASWPIDGKPKEIGRREKPEIIYYSLPIEKWGVIKTEAN